MKSLLLLFTVGMYCAVVNARYVIDDHGKLGKQFWGQNYTVMDGDNLTLHCGSSINRKIKGYRTNYWFWIITERHLGRKSIPKETLLRRQSPQGLVWRFRPNGFRVAPKHIPELDMQLINVNRYATGKYVCAVASVYYEGGTRSNYMEGTFQNVLVRCKPRIESMLRTKIQLTDGDKLKLDCTSSGYPTPEITWRRIDGRPLPIRTITHSKGVLSINDVGQLDRGQYQCTSSNVLGNDTRIFTVDITVRATIMKTEKSYASIGKDGAVKCVAVGIPRPRFSWAWGDPGVYEQKLSAEEGPAGRFQVKTDHYFGNSTSYLMIKNVQTDDLRDYECTLKNGDINQKRTIPLVGYSEPDSPIIQTVASSSRSITLSWKLGENDGGRPVQKIIIQYHEFNDTKWKSETIPADPRIVRHTIYSLKSGTRYTLRVIAVNDIGESRPSINHQQKTNLNTDLMSKTNKNENKEKESVNMIVMIAGAAGAFLVLIIAIVIVCVLMRNIQQNSAKKAAENAERSAKSANDDTTTALINFLQHGGDRLSTTTGSGGGDVLHLTTSNKWEFPRERLVLQNVLGSGAFGIVMKADAEGINGYNSGTTPVAVKFVKENESASAKKDLIAELELLKLIEPHTNVINLLGCCTRVEPLMVIVEFCAYGDLQSFLRASRGIRDQYYLDCYKRPSSRLTSNELLMFGTQIARGMAHLACLKVIHRDLAARNILVDENKVCKVSDFGFARDIYVEDHYTRKTAGGRFPIKWMAIESLLDGISTTKSDVWSFAIVLWEIITLGASPYPGMNSQEVVSFLQNGMRMDKPKHCSDELYNLLLDCWQVASHRRPNFEMLARYLDRMCADDFEYINMRTYDDHLYINFDGNTISENSKSGSLLKQDTGSKDNSEESNGEKD